MDKLKNLNEMYSKAADSLNRYEGKDFILPQLLKNEVKEINSNSITYNDYSAIIQTKGSQNGVLSIYLPNQWFYIASFFTDFYNELQKYKRYALKVFSKDRLKSLNGLSLTSDEESEIQKLSLEEESKKNLKRFVTDYTWWSGAKTIDRGDFYVSPILNSARLVNASQTFVADLCAFLSDKPQLVSAIINGENNIESAELLRQKAAATFLKKAMGITLKKDANFNRLEVLNLYNHTTVQLKINGFPLGRDFDQLPNRIDDVDLDVEWIFDNKKYVLYLEWTPEMMEKSFFPVYNKAYQGVFRMEKDSNGEYVFYEEHLNKQSNRISIKYSLQQIFYGAPGTGKSNSIKREVDDQRLPNVRTTFHPDSDYSTFVGAYKPTSVEVPLMTMVGTKALPVENADGTPRTEKKIVYEFVPQAFLKAYTGAWKNQDKPFFLIIEEINRGNCAQIFGDLFQLLDRKNGESEYPISPDEDIRKFLKIDKKYGFAALTDEQKATIPEEILSGELLKLPKNLHIWATINTSDQSLFPIDSAFKRRWDWQYMPIEDAGLNWKIDVNDHEYDWYAFLQAINKEVLDLTHSEDKQLGYFFAKAENNKIDAKTLVNKVYFYLWTDVFKDYDFESQKAFKKADGNGAIAFKDFFKNGEVDEVMAEQILINLELNNPVETEE
jgi:MoxR-like ATPase